MALVSRQLYIDGAACLDPGALYCPDGETAAPQDFAGLANSITCPTGQAPGSAFLVVSRAVNDALAMNSLHTLAWVDDGVTTSWPNYVICRQWMVGVDGDSKSAALVELRDKRQLMMGAANWQYNVRRHSGGTYSAADPAARFYTDSLNGSNPYTWQEVLNDLWLHFPSAIRGTAPTLPYTPLYLPENIRVHGDAWAAVGDLLERIQCRLVLNPVASTFSVVRVGAAQAGLASQVAAAAGRVMFDATPRQNLQMATVPETVRVYFPKYGVPPQSDAGGQAVKPYHIIDKPSNLAGAVAGSKLGFRTSVHAIYPSQTQADLTGGVPDNIADLENYATEIAAKVVNKLDLGTERGRIIYTGIVTSISLGSEAGSVCWRDLGGAEGCVTDYRTAEVVPDGNAPVEQCQPLSRSGWGRISGVSGLEALGSATCRVWSDATGTMADSGEDITVWDRLLAADATLDELTRVRWEYEEESRRFYVVAAACSADESTTVWGE